MQLDLFLDGREAILINEIVTDLIEARAASAGKALDRLREENPRHPDLPAFDRLVRSMSEAPPWPAGNLDPMIEAVAALVPAASRLLGAGARTFLLPWWTALARTDPPPAPTAAEPMRRYWVGSAFWHVGVEREAVRLWLPLCWLDPESFARHAPALPGDLVREAWQAFDREFVSADGNDARVLGTPWFPAWLALRHRWVAHVFHPDELPDGGAALKALRLLPGLLVLESHGYSEELIRQRRALRDLSPAFFRTYRRLVVEPRAPRI